MTRSHRSWRSSTSYPSGERRHRRADVVHSHARQRSRDVLRRYVARPSRQRADFSTGLWPDGTVVFRPGGPGFMATDGALGMKWGWHRAVRGQLRIEGRRLDGPAPPLRAEIPAGYGDFGFQSSALIFPTPGCWEVTGHVGTARLTFVTLVQRIGEGPSTRTAGTR